MRLLSGSTDTIEGMKLFLAPLLANGWRFATFVASAWETAMTLIGVEVGAPPLVMVTT